MAKKDNSAPIKSWPADDVQRRPVAELVPYARNARTHSPVQVDQIAASIREWGWTMPVLVDEDSGIIAGHGRVLAAQKLGLYDVPVMVARGWTAAQKRAYVLADNKLALNAGWDDETLKLELEDLNTDGFDLGLTGFSGDELNRFMGLEDEGRPEPDTSGGYSEQYGVIVMCRDEMHQQEIYDRLSADGLQVKVVAT